MPEFGPIDPGAALATFVSPIVAVLITLWLQARDRGRDRKEMLLRQLLATRTNPADPGYSVAITLIPVEFRRHAKVRAAHRDFIDAANRNVPAIDATQNKMISAMLEALGVKEETAADVVRSNYSSVGWGEWTKKQALALEALPRMADAMVQTADACKDTVDFLLAAQQQALPAATPQGATPGSGGES